MHLRSFIFYWRSDCYILAYSSPDIHGVLQSLEPAHEAKFDPSNACMEGTRKEILRDITTWVSKAGSDKLFWLYGAAGSGKSSISASIADRLGAKLGASFFCKRDNPSLRNPENVLPTLAYMLAVTVKPFAEELAKLLKQDPTLRKQSLQLQFTSLFVKPLKNIENKGRDISDVVIVVDALDECGSASSRSQILSCLIKLSKLASWLKIFLTSRPDSEIRFELMPDQQLSAGVQAQDLLSVDASGDIDLYTSTYMADMARKKHLKNWPDMQKVKELVQKAKGLFIWISTVLRLIEPELDVNDINSKLEQVLNNSAGDSQLDSLYTLILENVNVQLGRANNSKLQAVLGLIIVTSKHKPLPVSALIQVLPMPMGENVVRTVVGLLQSVLFEDEDKGGAVRLCHPSFADYMTSESRCPSNFQYDSEDLNAKVAQKCLEIMQHNLKFNICNLQSSHVLNKDVADLQAKVESHISPVFQYSCLYWADHLCDSNTEAFEDSGVKTQLEDIFIVSKPKVIFWIEVLSLLQETSTAISMLLRLLTFVKVRDIQALFLNCKCNLLNFFPRIKHTFKKL